MVLTFAMRCSYVFTRNRFRSAFLFILRDIKQEIDENANQEADATADFMQKIREKFMQLTQDTSSLDATNVILQAFEAKITT